MIQKDMHYFSVSLARPLARMQVGEPVQLHCSDVTGDASALCVHALRSAISIRRQLQKPVFYVSCSFRLSR